MKRTMDWNAQLFTKLYSKLALALGVTPREEDPELTKLAGGPLPPRYRAVPTAPGEDPQFLLAILNPGQYIPANLDPATKKEDRYALSVLLNSVPQFSWAYRPAATTVSNAYMSVLEYKETPDSQLTPEKKKELEENEATITQYKSVYDEYQLKYWDALDAYDAAYASWENGGPPVPRTLRLKLEAALRDWNGLGHKQAVESAIAVVAALEGLEPESFWARLMERYNRGTEKTRSAAPSRWWACRRRTRAGSPRRAGQSSPSRRPTWTTSASRRRSASPETSTWSTASSASQATARTRRTRSS
jgi:hypothetical protein